MRRISLHSLVIGVLLEVTGFTILPLSVYAYTNRLLNITADCDSDALCVELMIKDHNGKHLGYDSKTKTNLNEIQNSSYDEETVPTLSDNIPGPFIALEIIDPAPSVYNLNVIGTRFGIYSVSINIEAYGGSKSSYTVQANFDGIIDNNLSHLITLNIPIDKLGEVAIKRIIDVSLIRQEFKLAEKYNMLSKNYLPPNFYRHLIHIEKLVQKNRNREASEELHKLIEEINKVEKNNKQINDNGSKSLKIVTILLNDIISLAEALR